MRLSCAYEPSEVLTSSTNVQDTADVVGRRTDEEDPLWISVLCIMVAGAYQYLDHKATPVLRLRS